MNRIKFYDERIKNESRWPQKYTFKFIEPGLVSYKDLGFKKPLLLKKETIDQIIPSFIGKPVIVKHQDVDTKNFIDMAVGYITDITYNSGDGWYYSDVLITKDEGHEKINAGWGVSCLYTTKGMGDGGKYHDIEYEREILGGVGEHLALVENPRYEECLMVVDNQPAVLYNEKIYLEKFKPTEDNEMVTIIGKKDEQKGFSIDSLVKLANGSIIKLRDMIALANKSGGKTDEHQVADETEIDLGNGKTMKLGDMVALANKATDEGEESEEEKNKKKAEGDEKMKNCGCGGKEEHKHMENCPLYNSAGAKKFRNETDEKEKEEKEKEEKLKNEKISALEQEVAAYKEAIANGKTFVKIGNAKAGDVSEEHKLLNSGTVESNTTEAGLTRASKYFGEPAK